MGVARNLTDTAVSPVGSVLGMSWLGNPDYASLHPGYDAATAQNIADGMTYSTGTNPEGLWSSRYAIA